MDEEPKEVIEVVELSNPKSEKEEEIQPPKKEPSE